MQFPCSQFTMQFLHGLHGRYNLHMGSEIRVLESWQSQHAAEKNLITLWGIHRQKGEHILADYKLHKDDSVGDSLHLKNFLYSRFRHKHSYTSCTFVVSGPLELVPGVVALDCAAVANHGIWSPEYSRHPLSCGIVLPLPQKLFLSKCSHWVFPEFPQVLAWFAAVARPCLPHLTGGQAWDVTNRTVMSIGTT